MSNRDKILIRTGYLEHLGYYAIRALLTAKTKMNCSSMPVKNTQKSRKSWQMIHRSFNQDEHKSEVQRLIKTGKYIVD
jgi:hypothetical protein